MATLAIGAQLYSAREFCKTMPDVAATLQKVAKIGYKVVQISGFGPVDPKEVMKAVEDNGLTVGSTHMGWGRFQKELDKVIEEHQIYKCAHPAVGGIPGEYHTAEGLKKFLDELAPIAAKLAKAGMDFSYHNHNQELARCGRKTWLAMLYEQADPKILKAEIDVYWITAGGGDPAAWIRRCAGREPLVHFKDMTVMPDREQRFAEIGEGNLNWPAIIEACKDSGVQIAFVEQDNCYGRSPFECLETSYRNLRAMGLS